MKPEDILELLDGVGRGASLYITSDDYAFTDRDKAENHAASLENKAIDVWDTEMLQQIELNKK